MIRRGALLLAIFVAACGTKESANTLEVVAASSVETTFATAWASCPKTTAGQTSFGTLKVTNRLARPLVIREVTSLFGVTSFGAGTQLVDTMSARELPLACSPRAVETVRDELTVTTDAGAMKLGVAVIGMGPRIRVEPESLSLNDLPVVSSETVATVVPLSIRNNGNAPLTFTKSPSIQIANASVELETPIPGGFSLGPNGVFETRVLIRPLSPGPLTGAIRFDTDDPMRPALDLPINGTATNEGACSLTFDPAEIRVLSPRAGASVAIEARNSGTSTCTLSGFRFEGSNASLMSVVSLPTVVRVAPGAAYRIFVHADPLKAPLPFPTDLKMTFYANAPSMQPGELPVRAGDPELTSKACLTVAPTDLDFSTVQRTCSSGFRYVNVYNSCGVPVTLTDVRFASCQSSTSCNGFELVSPPPAGQVLNPGSSVPASLKLRFSPQMLGPVQDSLVLTADQAGTTQQYSVSLVGAGDTKGTNTDVFGTCVRPRANFLFVVAGGTTAAGQPGTFVTGFNALAAELDPHGDYQALVVSAGNDGGVMSSMDGGNAPVLRSMQDSNFVSELRARIIAAASSQTNIIESTARALTQIPFTNADGGTLNPPPVAIAITDRPDTSPGSVQSYLAAIDAGAPNAGVYVVAPFSNTSCGGVADDGRLAAFAGLKPSWGKHEFCGGWVDPPLGGLAWDCSPDRPRFLNALPRDAGTISVTVNGTNLPRVGADGGTQWFYDPSINAVQFTAGATDYDQAITITYETACYTYPP